MSRRKHTVLVIAVLGLAAGIVAMTALRGPTTMGDRFNRLRKGMTHEEVIAILGKPKTWEGIDDDSTLSWLGEEGKITVIFDPLVTDTSFAPSLFLVEPPSAFDCLLKWFGL